MTQSSRFALFGVAVTIASGCVALGLWQGRRLTARRVVNRVALDQRQFPELDLNLASPTELTAPLDQRRVVASGSYDHSQTIILRNRVETGSPGVHVVTPMRLTGREEAVLVLRGFVPASDAAVPDTSGFTRVSEERVSGIALGIPTSPDGGAPLEFRGMLTWGRLDRAALGQRIPYPILEVYLHVIPPEEASRSRALARPLPIPVAIRPLDDGPHLSYMLQWFGIAAVALGFGIQVLVRKPRGGPVVP